MGAAEDNICTFLAQQHKELAETFSALDKLVGPDNSEGRRNLFEYLKEQLHAHMAVTEELLYPRLAHEGTLGDAIQASTAAHAVMRLLLQELDQYVNDLSVWQASCKRLQQVFEEDGRQERQEIFRQVAGLPADAQHEIVQQARRIFPAGS